MPHRVYLCMSVVSVCLSVCLSVVCLCMYVVSVSIYVGGLSVWSVRDVVDAEVEEVWLITAAVTEGPR